MRPEPAEFTLEWSTDGASSMQNEADSISPELALRQGVGETTDQPSLSAAQLSTTRIIATWAIVIAWMKSWPGYGPS